MSWLPSEILLQSKKFIRNSLMSLSHRDQLCLVERFDFPPIVLLTLLSVMFLLMIHFWPPSKIIKQINLNSCFLIEINWYYRTKKAMKNTCLFDWKVYTNLDQLVTLRKKSWLFSDAILSQRHRLNNLLLLSQSLSLSLCSEIIFFISMLKPWHLNIFQQLA